MLTSIGTIDIADMIIRSLDHEKMLKDKLHSRNLEYILKLLLDQSDLTVSDLLSTCDKDKIEKMIEKEIDDNTAIAIKITSTDKDRFATIVMDVIQSKMDTLSVSDSLDSSPMADRSQSPYHTGSDRSGAFGYNQSQSPPMTQPSPVHVTQTYTANHHHSRYPPHLSHGFQLTPPPPVTTTKPHPPQQPQAPTLNFRLDEADDFLPLNPMDSLPISQNMETLSEHSPNINGSFLAHPQTDAAVPATANKSEDLADAFHQRMKDAIEKNNKGPKDASPLSNHHPASSTSKRKLITQQTNIHPMQQQKENTKPLPQRAAHPIAQHPIALEEEIYEYNDDEDEVPLGMDAPPLDLQPLKNEPETAFYPATNGYAPNQPPHEAHYAPTPREWKFVWDSSPRAQQARTPATSPPRISDPLLIRNALQGVAYYADKLDSLHSEYRRVYGDQQHYNSQLQALDSCTMDQNEYNHRYQSIQSQVNYMSQTLQVLIIGIYEQFQKMKQSLDTKYELQLDVNMRQQFDKFQRYHDQFAATQHQLLVFGKQQQVQKQQREQQAQQQMYPQQSYQVPPTPHNYRQRVENVNSWKQSHADQKMQYYQHAQAQQFSSVTPRDHGSFNYAQQQHRNYAAPSSYAQSTSAVPERRFDWGQQHKNGPNPTQTKRKMATTPRPNHASNNANNYIKKSGDIPQMGYVYIGSRMSQLISHIALSDREVIANQKRIENVISDILKAEKNFAGFDIVCYGSSTHKLFIKDYSDFDFCIRCKTLGISHAEAIAYIADGLKEKAEFERIKIVDCVAESVHGHYLKDVRHVSFFDTQSSRSVDLVLNNLPEIGSSRFISAYESIDPRFALLCRVVKYWSRQRKINDPLHGTLSTYALVLMVINFLQLRRVLPTLSIMIFDRETGLSPWSTQDDYQINVQKYRDFASKNEEPHSRLLVNFFKFYAFTFNFNKDVVSVRTGTYLRKSEKKWNNDQHWICVENPFNVKTNLTQSVDEKSMKRIWAEFKRAYSILCDSYKIYEVCKLAE